MAIPKITRDQLLVEAMHRCCRYHRDSPEVDIHHIKPRSESGTDDPDNLIVLCPTCHREAHRCGWNAQQLRLYSHMLVQQCSAISQGWTPDTENTAACLVVADFRSFGEQAETLRLGERYSERILEELSNRFTHDTEVDTFGPNSVWLSKRDWPSVRAEPGKWALGWFHVTTVDTYAESPDSLLTENPSLDTTASYPEWAGPSGPLGIFIAPMRCSPMHLSAVKSHNRYYDFRFGVRVFVGAMEDVGNDWFEATTRSVAMMGKREFSLSVERDASRRGDTSNLLGKTLRPLIVK
jgi:hypothetical protein